MKNSILTDKAFLVSLFYEHRNLCRKSERGSGKNHVRYRLRICVPYQRLCRKYRGKLDGTECCQGKADLCPIDAGQEVIIVIGENLVKEKIESQLNFLPDN